jgi:hypothetical protein
MCTTFTTLRDALLGATMVVIVAAASRQHLNIDCHQKLSLSAVMYATSPTWVGADVPLNLAPASYWRSPVSVSDDLSCTLRVPLA